jgi:hypothetical protein
LADLSPDAARIERVAEIWAERPELSCGEELQSRRGVDPDIENLGRKSAEIEHVDARVWWRPGPGRSTVHNKTPIMVEWCAFGDQQGVEGLRYGRVNKRLGVPVG